MLGVLIDPDKSNEHQLNSLVKQKSFDEVDFILIGGSLITEGNMESCLSRIKKKTDKPTIIFPGSPNQIDAQADAILLLSLVSGRNSELLIGKHVESSFKLKSSGLEILPTAYILIDGGKTTTVSYISGTTPIPQDKPGIAAATALAGSQLGMQLTYLDCGSGANQHASKTIINAVKNEIKGPLIVGGGIKTGEQAKAVWTAGADVIVVGNKLEGDVAFLDELVEVKAVLHS